MSTQHHIPLLSRPLLHNGLQLRRFPLISPRSPRLPPVLLRLVKEWTLRSRSRRMSIPQRLRGSLRTFVTLNQNLQKSEVAGPIPKRRQSSSIHCASQRANTDLPLKIAMAMASAVVGGVVSMRFVSMGSSSMTEESSATKKRRLSAHHAASQQLARRQRGPLCHFSLQFRHALVHRLSHPRAAPRSLLHSLPTLLRGLNRRHLHMVFQRTRQTKMILEPSSQR